VTLIGELMSRLKVPKEKIITGLMHHWIHPTTKNGRYAEGKEWEPYWKDQDTKLVHFIGKDNIVFTAFFLRC
jgi:hypothetical protein